MDLLQRHGDHTAIVDTASGNAVQAVLAIALPCRSCRGNRRRLTAIGPLAPKTADTGDGDIELDQFFLEATPDEEISLEMQALGELIRQHVETHYQRGPVAADANILSQSLVHVGISKGRSLDAQEVAALCLDPRTRQDALQHVLLRVIFASLDFHSRSEMSLLPISVATFLNEVPLPNNEPVGGTPGRRQRPGQTEQHQSNSSSLALRQWRRLSAFLLHPDRDQRTPLPADNATLVSKARALAAMLNTVLGLFTGLDPNSRQEQTRHLEAVVMECAKLGYVLFSHPSDWRFITEDPGEKGGIVVEAGLMKLSNRDGVPYSPPRRVVRPVVRRVSI
ncbi:hypothetical protein HRG_000835 [Hirsutella rhossiliensis]|uniref:Uncharacterized protein n=1 Tax=Hirsutella rhossiliensis TaxID=111463 RepID=A0A9P8SM46_9HYPO|nr:uncharacterized protein HRG_00835 [Hirsutella rhossiliensis]KAH0968193.1 hypothetical protein HRG_00835 [Hirsutella rhossiliensis]